ncbi:hypothetical protein [Streptosporangium sp. NPDC049644]|uniref:hypothetical protein n=1 Tax=Streptosporangium sp. NPDC049644 TaxID=3155507 RepID=UPI003443B0D7
MIVEPGLAGKDKATRARMTNAAISSGDDSWYWAWVSSTMIFKMGLHDKRFIENMEISAFIDIGRFSSEWLFCTQPRHVERRTRGAPKQLPTFWFGEGFCVADGCL